MTLHFSSAARRFVNVWGGEFGVIRCRVIGVRGEQLLVQRCDYDRMYAPTVAVNQIAPRVFVFA